MGKRGPKPTPTEILDIRGSWRAKARSGEPKPQAGLPDCPDWLVGESRSEWDRQVVDLDARRLMSKSYRAALVMFCEAWGTYVEACKVLAKEGMTTIGTKGITVKHPMIDVKNAAFDRCMKMGQQFGFSPAAQVGLSVKDKEEQSGGKSRFFAS